MPVIDFMVSTGELAAYNYVEVADTPDTENELKFMGCTDDEIRRIRDEAHDGILEVYGLLAQKGWQFDPARGFYKA